MPTEAHIVPFALLLPIVGTVMGIGVAFWAIYWDYRTKQLKYKERQLMIEKGLAPPPLSSEKRPPTLDECLRRGIIMVFLGVGLGIAYFVLLYSGNEPPAWICGVGGAIVGLIGIGYLIYYAIAKKHKNEAPEGGGNISIP